MIFTWIPCKSSASAKFGFSRQLFEFSTHPSTAIYSMSTLTSSLKDGVAHDEHRNSPLLSAVYVMFTCTLRQLLSAAWTLLAHGILRKKFLRRFTTTYSKPVTRGNGRSVESCRGLSTWRHIPYAKSAHGFDEIIVVSTLVVCFCSPDPLI
jgi:hypothetical protein